MRKTVVKKADLNTRAGRYFLAKQRGLSKKQASIEVGIDPRNSPTLERSQIYQAIEKKYFKGEFEAIMSVRELAEELKKNVVQDEDRGAKNKAIEIALGKIEPEKVSLNPEADRVYVILK